ncbi:MAG: hypothetical protein GY696_34910 [Gammaproteobacteria bacterium]|nr:hypothetical protein [Gammaproteobacteria bacterium]
MQNTTAPILLRASHGNAATASLRSVGREPHRARACPHQTHAPGVGWEWYMASAANGGNAGGKCEP